jgi:alanine dehydrogenase
MNGRKAKLIKKAVYKTQEPRKREYKQLQNGQILSDLHRSVYQEMKKECRNMTRKEVKANLKSRKEN